MNLSRLKESIKKHEGYRDTPYRDHLGFWTVGYGHLIHHQSNPGHQTIGALLDYLSNKEGHEQLLDRDIERSINGASTYLMSAKAWQELSDTRKEVLIEMAFQLGTGGLHKFRKLREAIIVKDWERAKKEMLDSTWAKQTPKRANSLADRMLKG
jgi:lysozyme